MNCSERFGHAAADDEQPGREQLLDGQQVLVKVRRPRLPADAALDPRRRRGPPLGVAAADLHVPQLQVGHEHAVVEQRGAGPGSEGDQEHRAALADARPEPHLGHARRVGVVHEVHRAAQDALHGAVRVELHPARIDVGRTLGDAVDDDGREADADGDVGADRHLGRDLLDHPGDGRDHGRRGRGLRGGHPVARRDELAGVQVHGRGLDAAAAHVHADGHAAIARVHAHATRVAGLVPLVRDGLPGELGRLGGDPRRLLRVGGVAAGGLDRAAGLGLLVHGRGSSRTGRPGPACGWCRRC